MILLYEENRGEVTGVSLPSVFLLHLFLNSSHLILLNTQIL